MFKKTKTFLTSLASKIRKQFIFIKTEIVVTSPHWPARAITYATWFKFYRVNVEEAKIEVVNGEIDRRVLSTYMHVSDSIDLRYSFTPPSNPMDSFPTMKERGLLS